ncbi:probable D-arabinose dehydrogenase [NAD(P)+] heavy chain [Zygosaccharomyces bailii]|nr:probable D-arabinose dehydrogenase [NAD(P)+] heavy chain [Zygosaccharomyces bailii]
MVRLLHPRGTEISFTLNNGVRIPALALGTANPPESIGGTKQAVKTAIKAGYRHIDTAWAYGSEPYVGEAIKELLEEGVIRREDIFITSKVWPVLWDDAERSLNESLQSLGVDYIDLWLQHWPICYAKVKDPHGINGLSRNPEKENGEPDYETSGDWIETYVQMEKIYLNPSDRRVRSIGVSNFPEQYLERIIYECAVKPTVNQVEMHPKLPQFSLNKFCLSHNILTAAYSPLGSHGAPNTKIPLVEELAEKYSVSPGGILNSYHIRQGHLVIARSLNNARIASNMEFATLTEEDLDKLDNLGVTEPKRYVDEKWNAIVPGFTGKGPKI